MFICESDVFDILETEGYQFPLDDFNTTAQSCGFNDTKRISNSGDKIYSVNESNYIIKKYNKEHLSGDVSVILENNILIINKNAEIILNENNNNEENKKAAIIQRIKEALKNK